MSVRKSKGQPNKILPTNTKATIKTVDYLNAYRE